MCHCLIKSFRGNLDRVLPLKVPRNFQDQVPFILSLKQEKTAIHLRFHEFYGRHVHETIHFLAEEKLKLLVIMIDVCCMQA